MNTLLKNRRSIRKYKDKQVNAETVDLLIEAMLRSPSSKSINPWEILLVEDEGIVHALANAKAHGAKFLAGATQCLVVIADPTKTDVWIEDTSIVLTVAHLRATDLGLGSCWIQIRNREAASGQSSEAYVRQVLNIPETMAVEGILSFGYPDEEKAGHPDEKLQWDKVHRNVYGQGYK